MRNAVRPPHDFEPGDVKSAGYLRNITDTGHFRSGYNACPGCGGPKWYYAGFCAQCRGNKNLPDPVARQQRKQDGKVHYALCGAPRSSAVIRATGVTCMNVAGWKTPHPGIGHCYLHGGLSPQQMLHALRIKAEMEMREEAAREARAAEEAEQWRKQRRKMKRRIKKVLAKRRKLRAKGLL